MSLPNISIRQLLFIHICLDQGGGLTNIAVPRGMLLMWLEGASFLVHSKFLGNFTVKTRHFSRQISLNVRTVPLKYLMLTSISSRDSGGWYYFHLVSLSV